VTAFKKMWGDKIVIGDDAGGLSRAVAVEAHGRESGLVRHRQVAAASPGIEFKGAPEGYRVHGIIISGARRGSAARASMANTT
jgi:urea transport system substrate-binding protein